MFSHHMGRVLAIAIALLLSACKSLSPDGRMSTVAAVAGQGLNKNVVKIGSAGDAALARNEVSRLLRAPLSADAAVQVALLNNAGLQAAYNRLGVAEAVAVQTSRPPLPSFSYDWVKTSIELDVERQIVASILSLATWPARSKLAGVRFEQAELRAAQETLRVAAETRRAYIRAVAARQILTALNEAKASAMSAASLSQSLTETGAVNKLDHAKRQVFATELEAQVTAARQQADATEERLTRLLGLWGTDLAGLLPDQLPPLPGHARRLGAVEQEAMDRRVDIAVARLETEALARSFGLTRNTRLINVLDASGISKTQKDKGEPSADGGGYNIVFEVPLYDFGKAKVREAEQRYFEALNLLREKAINARSEAREAFSAYKATYAIAAQFEREVLPLRDTISAETELQFNAMQVDAFTLLEAARAKAQAKVASIEAKRNFWPASTDLSVAVLGGGSLSEGSGMVVAVDNSGAAGRE
ncbi:MAG TPA: TolC family protein [Methyloceanibacter sp.]|nr:TolC family protein [Methyloceanibacter sp.]